MLKPSLLAVALLTTTLSAQSVFRTFGDGCGPGPLQLRNALGTMPRVGETVLVDVEGIPGNATAATLALGLSDQALGGTALPIALDALGMAGCSLYQSMESPDLPFAFAGGRGRTSIPIPALHSLVGGRFFIQAVVLAPVNRFGAITSNGAALTIGPPANAILRGPISDDLFAVRVTGDPGNRVNLVFIGDGYQQQELGAWAAHVDAMVARLLSGESPPYERYANFLNIYRVDLVSAESGIDDPGRGIYVNTALDGCNCCVNWRTGQCQVDFNKTHTAIDAATPGIPVHWRLVALNTPLFLGGAHFPSRGNLAVYGTDHALTFNIVTHEAGHGFHGLQDEYHYSQHANNRYTGGEPTAVNLTADPARQKWAEWVGFAQPGLGTVGYHEGGLVTYGRGIWRPSPQSRMNNFRYEFDAISKERAIHSIYELVDPFDDHGPRNGLVQHDAMLWVRLVDPAVLRVEWKVDGRAVGTGPILDLGTINLSPGLHVIEARGWDRVLDHAFSNNQNPHPLDLVRRDTTRLTQIVRWSTIAP